MYPVFLARGTRPWSLGYQTHKRREIVRAVREGLFRGGDLAPGYGLHLDERVVEYPWFLSRLPAGPGRLLDAGSVLNHKFLLDLPELREKTITIATLQPEAEAFWHRGVSYAFTDLRDTCFKDACFDWVVCVSTLEHIGLDNAFLYSQRQKDKEAAPDTYLLAVRELRRVVRSGGTLFLSVPFGRYANHGWFQVFDKQMLDRVIDVFAPSAHTAAFFRYSVDGWSPAHAEELKDATCFDIHTSRRLDPDLAASARGLACIELIR
ncbi:MAG: class I SAM-dependent methyltransferase [Candidatus Eisenbacteria bacterium]|nr:class I SAM-dependent methyltransferase [Candidatus Eisenbacteria bacterium]